MSLDAEDYGLTGDLVDIAEVAEMGNADVETAREWTEQDSFPDPIARPEGGPIWSRGAVYKWLLEHGDEYEPPVD